MWVALGFADRCKIRPFLRIGRVQDLEPLRLRAVSILQSLRNHAFQVQFTNGAEQWSALPKERLSPSHPISPHDFLKQRLAFFQRQSSHILAVSNQNIKRNVGL